MTDFPRTNLDGYNLVLDNIRARIKPAESPKAWLAQRLGVSRQLCFQWGIPRRDGSGVPRARVAAVAELTGLSPFQIRPEDVVQNLPNPIFDAIAGRALENNVSFGEMLLQIITEGLKSHGQGKGRPKARASRT